MAGEADGARDPASAAAGRASASLNDDLVDIRLLQQLPANSIDARTSECARLQALYVRTVDVQNASDDRKLADHLDQTNRHGYAQNHDRVIGKLDLDHDLKATYTRFTYSLQSAVRLIGEKAVASYSNSSRNGWASSAMAPLPISSMAATMRPLRPSARSASATMRALGVAVGDARRKACAMASSRRLGLSAHAVTNAPAVERLMPA
jgi:hypothetical protein